MAEKILPDYSNLFFLFTDLETTNLEAQKDFILETSVIVTDRDLNEIGRYHSLSLPKEKNAMDLIRASMNNYVLQMHSGNGLLRELEELYEMGTWPTVTTVEQEILTFLNSIWKEGAPIPVYMMAGHSINSLDKPFVKHHMPELHSHLSHRTVDISAQLRFFPYIVGAESPVHIPGDPSHRAEDDNFHALQETRDLRDWYRLAIDAMKQTGMDEAWKQRKLTVTHHAKT